MRIILEFLAWFIVIMSITNLVRMMLYLVGGDIYAIKQARRNKAVKQLPAYQPTVSLVVPAHNEGVVIEETLKYLLNLDYPQDKLEIIVVNDGSTDNTLEIIHNFIIRHKAWDKIKAFSQRNMGKAEALNNAIKNMATGELVMCLDGDSLIAADGVRKAVEYFREPDVVAMASNVNIFENGSILGLAQRFEYLISYNMKKAQTTYNIEYIIGGIGSMFRRDVLELVGYYDTNTMTEDIDLTMKIIAHGNKKYRVVYASDCVTWTEAVPSFKSLIKQRYRWKYGRMQTFLKNPSIFFSTDKNQSKWLSWIILPQSIFQELLFVLEPAVVSFILVESIIFRDPFTFLIALSVISAYILVNIWSSSHLTFKDRLRLSFYAPSMYLLLYLLSITEYAALMKSFWKLPNLRQSIRGAQTTWVSPERSGAGSHA